jgi:dihydrofolate reductase
MAKLIYSAITSLDGYIEDEAGKFDWSAPDPEVHAFVNDLERPVGTYLYGRRMYEVMTVWQTIGAEPAGTSPEQAVPEQAAPEPHPLADPSPEELDFAEVWRAADKVVYSRTLDAVSTPRTRLERELDPEAVRRMKEAADRDLNVGGPGLAQHLFAAGLVDEVNLFVCPVVVGGGKPGLPRGVRLDLELLDERRFGNGVVHLHHAVR